MVDGTFASPQGEQEMFIGVHLRGTGAVGAFGTIAHLCCIIEGAPTPASSTWAVYIMDHEVCPMSEGIFP